LCERKNLGRGGWDENEKLAKGGVDPTMRDKIEDCAARPSRERWVAGAGVVLLPVLLAGTGCMSSYSKHSAALAVATAPVIEQATAAYASANRVHALRTDYDAITEFDRSGVGVAVYNPRTVPPLLTAKDIQSRLAVLAAFQAYVTSLVAVTSGTDSPQLQAAAKSAGAGLTAFGNTLAPSVDAKFGIAVATASTTQTTVSTLAGSTTTTATTTVATPVDPITPDATKGISTAVDAFGQYLASRKVKKELPPWIVKMDPQVRALCNLLESDIALLKGIEDRDYNYVINQQTLFLRVSKDRMDPGVRREMIVQLPAMAREQQESDRELTQLGAALFQLSLAHQELAADAKGNNPETLKQKLADLESAGEELGKFYSSQP
jgi:hypothetical protein